MALDLATSGDIKRLARILAVSDVRTKDGDALDDGEEDIGGERCLRGEADDHEVSSRAEVVDCLLVRGGGRGGDDSGVWTQAVAGSLDVGDEVARLPEVNPGLCAKGFDERTLLGTGVDGADAETDGYGVLDCEVSKSSASTGEADPVAGLRVRVLDGAVNSDTLEKTR